MTDGRGERQGAEGRARNQALTEVNLTRRAVPPTRRGARGSRMAAEIYIYSEQPLKEARGDLEEDLEETLGEWLEVTAGGGGSRGWDIGVTLSEAALPHELIPRLAAFLREWGVPDDTYFQFFAADWKEGEEPQRIEVFAQ